MTETYKVQKNKKQRVRKDKPQTNKAHHAHHKILLAAWLHVGPCFLNVYSSTGMNLFITCKYPQTNDGAQIFSSSNKVL